MSEQEREFKGVWIDKKIWLDARLNALEKIIFAEIDSLDNEASGCYATNKYLSEFCQCSETKVSTAISKLINLGYVYIKSFNGRQRILKSRVSNFERQGFKKEKAGSANLKANNIDNNISISINDKKKERKTTYDEIIQASEFSEKVKQSIYEFIKMRKLIKKPMTDRALTNLISRLKRLSGGNNETADKILNQSINKSWQDIYELKTEKQETSKKQGDSFLDFLNEKFEMAKQIEE